MNLNDYSFKEVQNRAKIKSVRDHLLSQRRLIKVKPALLSLQEHPENNRAKLDNLLDSEDYSEWAE